MLDISVCEAQASLIEKLTTTGKTVLDKDLLKTLWMITATSEEQLKFCHGKLMERLKTKHAQVRYGAFLLVDDLFRRSEFYREYFMATSFEEFIALTLTLKVEPNSKHLLQPKGVAQQLKKDALRALQQWRQLFRDKHPQVVSGCQFIQETMMIDIDGDEVRQVEEERRERDRIEFLLSSLRQEVELHAHDITSLITHMDHCFCLLFEKLSTTSASEEESDSESEAARSLSLRGYKPEEGSSVPMIIPRPLGQLVITEDNEEILQNLKDSYSLAKNRQLPRINKWLQRLQSITEGDEALRKRIESMRKLLMGAVNRYVDVKIVYKAESDCESDDDFEEVKEHEANWGEEDLPILSRFRDSARASTSSTAVKQMTQIAQLLLESDEVDGASPSSSVALPGEPVKWACRTAFPSGKLCPRMDRYKCPFHGKIIGRDKLGIPTDPKDRLKEEAKQAKLDLEKVPDWQDPKHLEEIKNKTGLDLKLRKPRKGKASFSQKYPGLVDPSKLDVSRKRLANKVFRKKSEQTTSAVAGTFSIEERD